MTGVDKYFAGRTSGGESRTVNKKTAPHVATNDAGASDDETCSGGLNA